MLSMLKVIEEMMKLLNDTEVHTYIIILHTIYVSSLLYNDYARILEYPVSSPLVVWLLVYVVSTQSMLQLMLHL